MVGTREGPCARLLMPSRNGHQRVDDTHSNARRLWQADGEPVYPTAAQLAAYKAASALIGERISTTPLTGTSRGLSLVVDMPPFGVAAITLPMRPT